MRSSREIRLVGQAEYRIALKRERSDRKAVADALFVYKRLLPIAKAAKKAVKPFFDPGVGRPQMQDIQEALEPVPGLVLMVWALLIPRRLVPWAKLARKKPADWLIERIAMRAGVSYQSMANVIWPRSRVRRGRTSGDSV